MISILGAGAFGTALAQNYAAAGRDVLLWARGQETVASINTRHENQARLPGIRLSNNIQATTDLAVAASSNVLLLCLPMQQLRGFLAENQSLFKGKALVGCCKGIDLETLSGVHRVVCDTTHDTVPAVLTGPGFATDIAAGLPTAMTLACDHKIAANLQTQLSTQTLRLYLSADLTGAELGGALKNVIAIACGAAIGAGLGESARASIMTRGFAEMQRLATEFGALPETLTGLSGFGDLTLTCTSDVSRNYRFGLALGGEISPDLGVTVEGVATAQALSRLSAERGIDLPVTETVAQLTAGKLTLKDAVSVLLSRPLRKEN